ncbi:uncharacterized protein LOC115626552 [Scaptodrosophila lebanonensis]|uniref:Uncharacterized protein LOC115626552 n=1 Tax=Drosophila lebanonensis TaxID=7225 RepID=A0A6J2TQK5_DROLE|nr:uncharacterized protein LOC115626552 [Scaptodrosophila lebanonensis]
MTRSNPEVYGIPPDMSINYGVRIYALATLFALIALAQWLVIGFFVDLGKDATGLRYGIWVVGTFFGISMLAWTNFGRKFPINIIISAIIIESSTMYIGKEQQMTKSLLVNSYASIIVVALVTLCIFWGAYFPMPLVPGDLVLSLLVAGANIMIIVFFINGFSVQSSSVYTMVRNFFALFAVVLIMYTATIIHNRQFDVPKNEYLFLSTLLFFGYMLLHERMLALS